MKCVHCSAEIPDKGLWKKIWDWDWRSFTTGNYLCETCDSEMMKLQDLPITIIFLFAAFLFLVAGLLSVTHTVIAPVGSLIDGFILLGAAVIFGFRSSAFRKMRDLSRKIDEFYEVKK